MILAKALSRLLLPLWCVPAKKTEGKIEFEHSRLFPTRELYIVGTGPRHRLSGGGVSFGPQAAQGQSFVTGLRAAVVAHLIELELFER